MFKQPFKSRLLSISALAVMASVSTIYGCSHNPTSIDADIEPCAAVDKLISDHGNKFADIRKQPRPFNAITIWQTDYEVIKDRCEIWGWGQGNINYVCSIVSPTKDVAAVRYSDSIKRLEGCLNSDWISSEAPRKVGNGLYTRFLQKDNNTAVSVHLVETPGVFNSEWTTYASVGNYSRDI